tara:strand:+ start:393 stop:1214 length:822 start_codon:yes stop_codon:yes gene_type:complete
VKTILLEDFHQDILSKAMRGLSIGKNEMANRLNVHKSAIDSVLQGALDEELIRGMANELKIDGEKLVQSSKKEWMPPLVQLEGLKQFNLPFGQMLVNTFLIWCMETRFAWVFDTGPDAEPIIEFIRKENLSVSSIFLTHTHLDHISCLKELISNIENPEVLVHESEPLESATFIREGFEARIGKLSLRSLHTHGHSSGGMTYAIDGLNKPIAIVGDALFAGSMGGGMISYQDALRTNREKIMTLSDETILCPGHGPMTTIAEEKKFNPFFPEF